MHGNNYCGLSYCINVAISIKTATCVTSNYSNIGAAKVTINCFHTLAGTMILLVLSIVFFLHGATAIHDSGLGQSFYLPNYDLNSESLQGGFPIFEPLPEECLKTTNMFTVESKTAYYEDTATFYKSLSSTFSLSADVENDFTMGATLDGSTNSISGSTRTVKGLTLQVYSTASKDYLISSCLRRGTLSQSVSKNFENLSPTIEKPWTDAEWAPYDVFLKNYGSHYVTQVYYGSALYQYCFSDTSRSYTQKQYSIKACVNFAGPTVAPTLNISACAGLTSDEIKSVSSLATSSRLVVRGGTDNTRAELYTSRTNEKIKEFLKEANETHQPIQYRFESIWSLLKARYMNTKHFPKALNLEAYYKGYKGFQCSHQAIAGVELQKFTHTEQSTPSYPSFHCIIPPQGCQVDDDCHHRFPHWCECKGSSCLRHYLTTTDTGKTRKYAAPYKEEGWGWQGCTRQDFTCGCHDRNWNWLEVWRQSLDEENFVSKFQNISFETQKAGKSHKEL